MKTIDLRTRFEKLYKQRRGTVSTVTVPALNFLMADGAGNPNDNPSFQEAVQLLYGLAYTLKFSFRKAARPIDFPVMPLEALWWMSDHGPFRTDAPERWRWTLMIMQPDIVRATHLREAASALRERKDLPVKRVRLDKFREGLAVQALHIGPYNEEERTLDLMRAHMEEHKLAEHGRHHEIYFSDPRRTPPERYKTILRQPVRRS